jgi:hypothetical protein
MDNEPRVGGRFGEDMFSEGEAEDTADDGFTKINGGGDLGVGGGAIEGNGIPEVILVEDINDGDIIFDLRGR